jgi:selenocysteine lyase/cysteine desulfurase
MLHATAASPTPAPWPTIVGADDFGGAFAEELGGQVNLDYAATTPSLRAAVDAVLRALPAYGSVHRGGGARSRLPTDAYEAARGSIAAFVDSGPEHVVVFVRNTTEAINLVSASLPRRSRILCSPLEHHANLLPWRDHEVEHLPFARSSDELVEQAAAALNAAARSGRSFDVLAVCGASNVTGEVMPVIELASAAHATGTQILVDAAQLAPHREISVRELDVDFLALSGHKLYAPFGSGALIMRGSLLQDVPPLLKGGGAVRLVTLDDVAWADLPHRFEAGTPNVLGAIALAAACDELAAHGMAELERQEQALAERLWRGLGELESCSVLRAWPHEESRVSVASFTLEGHESREVAETLAETHGIAVRSGLFCAHPFVRHLLETDNDTADLVRRAHAGEDLTLAGAVRASIGIGVAPRHIDRLLEGLSAISLSPSRRRLAAG